MEYKQKRMIDTRKESSSASSQQNTKFWKVRQTVCKSLMLHHNYRCSSLNIMKVITTQRLHSRPILHSLARECNLCVVIPFIT